MDIYEQGLKNWKCKYIRFHISLIKKIVVMSYILDLKFVNIEFEYLLKKSRFAICLWSSPTWFKRCVWVMLNMYW